MQLGEMCEPLFLYLCRLQRSLGRGKPKTVEAIRADIQALFKRVRMQASKDPALARQFEKVEKPLVFFVDYTLRQNDAALASPWQDLAYTQFQELAGDERFFRMLDSELVNDSAEARERLAVYYTCLGLGFEGLFAGEPATIREYMARIRARLSAEADGEDEVYLCPQAYRHTDERPFHEPVRRKLTVLTVVFLILVAFWFVGSSGAFWLAARDIDHSLKKITRVQDSDELMHSH